MRPVHDPVALELPLDPFEPTGKRSGEASWASFTRLVQHTCEAALCYEIVEGDADRCPTGLPVVSMQVSLRDVVVMGIMAGMRVLESTDISLPGMAGAVGTSSSSKHPILGDIISFSPNPAIPNPGWRYPQGIINKLWVRRMQNQVPVAGRLYDREWRRRIDQIDKDWVPVRRRIENSNDRTVILGGPTPDGSPLPRQDRTSQNGMDNELSPSVKPGAVHSRYAEASGSQTALPRTMHDGLWSLVPSRGLLSPASITNPFERLEENSLGGYPEIDDVNQLLPKGGAVKTQEGEPEAISKENTADSCMRFEDLNRSKPNVSQLRGEPRQRYEPGGTASSAAVNEGLVDSSRSWIKR